MQVSDPMGFDPLSPNPASKTQGVGPQPHGKYLTGPKDTRFRELLEDIERLRVEGQKLAKPAATAGKGETQDLDLAMDLADRTHETAMDMRRRLEEAFRRHVGG